MNQFFNYRTLLKNKQKAARVAVITLLVLAALFLFVFQTGNHEEQKPVLEADSDSISEVETDSSLECIVVDVAGAVKAPAVVELPADSRINDAIEAAGGLTSEADISQINRAAILSDGEKIFVPKKSDTTDGEGQIDDQTGNESIAGQNESANGGKVNINQAASDKLQEIPGVGPVTADKIIAYRMEHGMFRKLEDLKKVSGIGEKTFEKMQPYICI